VAGAILTAGAAGNNQTARFLGEPSNERRQEKALNAPRGVRDLAAAGYMHRGRFNFHAQREN
jgi:hypothetical protein